MQLKFITVNIWQGEALDRVCAFLDKEKPDVVVMQEVYNGTDPKLEPRFRSYEELKKRLDFPYYDHEAAFIEDRHGDKIPEGNAAFSRFPIVARDVVFFNEPFRDDYIDDIKNNPIQPHVLLYSALKTPAGAVHVYNVHGPWDLNGDNYSEKRRQMTEAIIAATTDRPNVIVAGDTNAQPTNQAILDLEKHIPSVFGRELTSTFNMRHKTNPGYATARVDMVFASSNLKVISKSCPDVDLSDHYPLIVTFEIPEVNS
jgi:endonuclease/exonuclease/phosphatase family metal-dependent hydrolase